MTFWWSSASASPKMPGGRTVEQDAKDPPEIFASCLPHSLYGVASGDLSLLRCSAGFPRKLSLCLLQFSCSRVTVASVAEVLVLFHPTSFFQQPHYWKDRPW